MGINDFFELDVLKDASVAVAAVTPAQMTRATEKLEPIEKDEVPLGTIHSEVVRKINVAMQFVMANSQMARAKSLIADTKEESDSLHADYHRLERLADVMGRIFWLQVEIDMGGQRCEAKGANGIRENWMVVKAEEPSAGPGDILRGLIARMGPPEE